LPARLRMSKSLSASSADVGMLSILRPIRCACHEYPFGCECQSPT
jgi:hypothetical protein